MRTIPTLLAGLLTLAVLAPSATAQPIDYGIAQLGEIRTACFFVCFGSGACTNSGTIHSVNVGSPFFVRGLRLADPDDAPCTTGMVSTPVTLPVTVPSGRALFFDIDLIATTPGTVVRDVLVNGADLFTLEAGIVPAPPCTPSTDALCLQDDRFTVRTLWRTGFGTRGKAPIVPGVTSDDSGLFYFFNANNWEILLKVLNGCGTNDRFWVFAAATTNVEYTITVTDTQEQQVKSYFNPMGPAAQPIQDTNAFATCP